MYYLADLAVDIINFILEAILCDTQDNKLGHNWTRWERGAKCGLRVHLPDIKSSTQKKLIGKQENLYPAACFDFPTQPKQILTVSNNFSFYYFLQLETEFIKRWKSRD